MEFKIVEENIEALEKKLKTIGKKCAKYGNEFKYERKGEIVEKVVLVEDETKKEMLVNFIIVDVEGIAKVNDWKFIASVEYCEGGNVFRAVTDVEIPERYYNVAPICEHCKTKRSRKSAYIIRNVVTGEFKQVGKSCLKDYTGGLDAQQVAALLSWFREVEEACKCGKGYMPRVLETKRALMVAAECVKHFGYIKKAGYYEPINPDATCGVAWDICAYENGWYNGFTDAEIRKEIEQRLAKVDFKAEEQAEYVDALLNWVAEQEESNNYFHNLKVVCAGEYVKGNNLGILVSAIACYNKAMQTKAEREARLKAQEEAAKKSDFVGKVGERINIKVKEMKCVYSSENQWGMTFLYNIVDENNNIYLWSGSVNVDCENVKELKGTIKDHKWYKNMKQTVLTRCKAK